MWDRIVLMGAVCLGLVACSPAPTMATAPAEPPAPVVDARIATAEANKKVVIDFYNAALNEKDWEKASAFIGDRYVQHNQGAVDGPEGIKAHIENLKTNFPQNHGEIKRAIAEGDLVALHIHVKRTPDALGFAIVDIFRVADGKVVEHWDVVQSIPDPKNVKNTNTMF